VLPKRSFLLCLTLLLAVRVSHAQRSGLSGTWTAKSASGLTVMGTWTAQPDSVSGAVRGTWAMVDAQGRTVANGGWSAAKSKTQWTGAWRATIAGSDGEYSGTWSANADLAPNARLVDLFEHAMQGALSGGWRTGSQSGGWSVRTSSREGAP
jgi:hypothetical protein